MNFQSATGAKAWRDIWGSGQGIGVVDTVRAGGRTVSSAWPSEYRRGESAALR